MELHSSISKSKSSNLEFHGTADRMFNTLQDYAQSLHSELKDEGLFGDNEKATILKEIQSVVGIISTHFNLAKASVVNTNGANLLPVEVRVSTTSEKEFQRTLPNGLEVEACIGELGDTVSALAHVLDWGILLKKNAPEKLLKRPPVRFIFDVLKTLNESCNLKIGGNDKFNDCPTWDEVSSSRDSKLNFIRQVRPFCFNYYLFKLNYSTFLL